jgi:hypothetical protein
MWRSNPLGRIAASRARKVRAHVTKASSKLPGLLSLRFGLVMSGAILIVYAAWILAVEIVRPSLRPVFPFERGNASHLEYDQTRAAAAASIGVIRGDLWADDAILLAEGVQDEITAAKPVTNPDTLEAVRTVAEKAAMLSPHDSRIWLLIAVISARIDPLDHRVGRSLMMSYFTGPDTAALMPLRLVVATRSDVVSDPDFQILVSGEIRTIIRSKPELKSAILFAYRSALPAGKEFIANTLRDLDPELLAVARRDQGAR